MTSEKAVEVLRKIKVYANGDDLEALDMAIESLIYDYARGVQKGLELSAIRNKGEWIDNETTYANIYRQTCTCSVCGKRSVRPLGEFCRWCGADNRGDDNVRKPD